MSGLTLPTAGCLLRHRKMIFVTPNPKHQGATIRTKHVHKAAYDFVPKHHSTKRWAINRCLKLTVRGTGGSFCHLWWKNERPLGSEGFLFQRIAHSLTKGGKKTPRTGVFQRGPGGFCVCLEEGNPGLINPWWITRALSLLVGIQTTFGGNGPLTMGRVY